MIGTSSESNVVVSIRSCLQSIVGCDMPFRRFRILDLVVDLARAGFAGPDWAVRRAEFLCEAVICSARWVVWTVNGEVVGHRVFARIEQYLLLLDPQQNLIRRRMRRIRPEVFYLVGVDYVLIVVVGTFRTVGGNDAFEWGILRAEGVGLGVFWAVWRSVYQKVLGCMGFVRMRWGGIGGYDLFHVEEAERAGGEDFCFGEGVLAGDGG
ncbi:hypothetical protein Tco_1030164 [Tanacetum coccineum]|uniref:Uncharacterized protein n=1 Tax=Tanacetum coccineum TaxID=301880 RepID=A0ABQ5G6N6_9ASTR